MKTLGFIIDGAHGSGKDTTARMMMHLIARKVYHPTLYDDYTYESMLDTERHFYGDGYTPFTVDKCPISMKSCYYNIPIIRFADSMKESLSKLTGLPLFVFHDREYKDSIIRLDASTGGIVLVNDIDDREPDTIYSKDFNIRVLMYNYTLACKKHIDPYVFARATLQKQAIIKSNTDYDNFVYLFTDIIAKEEREAAHILTDNMVYITLQRLQPEETGKLVEYTTHDNKYIIRSRDNDIKGLYYTIKEFVDENIELLLNKTK